jgi:hypothetical protein
MVLYRQAALPWCHVHICKIAEDRYWEGPEDSGL